MKELTQRIHKFFLQSVGENLDLRMGPQSIYDEVDIARVLEHASVNVISPTEASGQLGELDLGLPDGDSVFYHLGRQTPDQIQERFDRFVEDAVAEARRQHLLGAPVDLAIDPNDERWYGKPLPFSVRGRPDRGTRRFLRHANASIVLWGRRLLIHSQQMTRKTRLEDVVLSSIRRAEELGLRIRRVYLDRGFCTTGVLRLFHELQIAYVIPARMTETVKHLKRQMLRRKNYIVSYTMRGQAGAVETTLFLHWNSRKKRWIPFLTNLPVTEANRASLGEGYRRRWSIETAFRTRNNLRIRTRSGNRSARLALYLISLVLYNLWVLLNVWEAKWFGEKPRKPRVSVYRFRFYLLMLLFEGQF